MGIDTVIAVALVAAFGAVIMKGFGYRGANVMTAAVITLMLSYMLTSAAPVFEFFQALPDRLVPYADSAIKAVGIGYISGITADVCRELGENGIAKAVSSVARIEIILVALPHLYEITDLASELLGG